MESPDLPPRFPCWVKAVYSWGGESKRDLGFIEGDLIECLNAGDGSWWVGRLYRDKRMVGSFPSNFVKVLDPSYHPVNRVSKVAPPVRKDSVPSPGQQSPSTSTNTSPRKSLSMFRKPFTAYGAAESPLSSAPPSPAGSVKKSFSPKPYSSMKTAGAPAPKPNTPLKASVSSIPAPIPRAASPLPPRNMERPSRAPSPLAQLPISRAQSPSPYLGDFSFEQTRAPSPLFQRPMSRMASPAPHQQEYEDRFSRAPSPLHHRPISRLASPAFYHEQYAEASRAPSPSFQRSPSRMDAPAQDDDQYDDVPYRATSPMAHIPMSRLVSPAQYDDQYKDVPYRGTSPTAHAPISRLASPALYDEEDPASPPPPPPPAHRVVYFNSQPEPSPPYRQEYLGEDQEYIQRQASPAPSRGGGRTPSPFREAMHDVMASLDDMSVGARSPSPVPQWNIRSPDVFSENFSQPDRSQSRVSHRHGGTDDQCKISGNDENLDPSHTKPVKREATPKLANYLRRMDSRLKERSTNSEPRYNRPAYDRGLSSEPPDGVATDIQSLNGLSGTDSGYASTSRPSSYTIKATFEGARNFQHELRTRQSAHELGRPGLARSFTAKSAVTDFSSASHMTDHSLMSGYSAGGFSATSAGSLARRGWNRSGSLKGRPKSTFGSPSTDTSMSGILYHPGHASQSDALVGQQSVHSQPVGSSGLIGGFQRPVVKKKSFLRRVIDSAKTSAAGARSTISNESDERSPSPQKMVPKGVTAIAGGTGHTNVASSMGLGSNVDWVQMRRDVNRCNSLSRAERHDRAERCEMMDMRVVNPINVLLETAEGDESQDGYPVTDPTNFAGCNFLLVDKNVRLLNNTPAMVSPATLAQAYLCRPYRSDVQRLRAIFTWISERIFWEEDYEGDVDTHRVLQTKRGCSKEVAALVYEMCAAIGVHAEVVRGHLKNPAETLAKHDLGEMARSNHYWNAVIVEGEWRMMDCSLAAPSNPYRGSYSEGSSQTAETWWFLTRPMEICYTHVPELSKHQHILPTISQHVLMALPVVGSSYFKSGIQLWDFDTSLLHLEGLEAAHIHFSVPEDIEIIAEVEARSFAQDPDGDMFESGAVEKKRAIAQAEFMAYAGESTHFKRYTVKALLPSSANVSNTATLKIYAGRRGLTHSINSIPHPLALSIPLNHQGANPAYDFFTRHPTPHALRNELYVASPLCRRLAVNNTFVFTVRQHASSSFGPKQSSTSQHRPASALSIAARPTSAMSMASVSISGSGYSNPSASGSESSASGGDANVKPAKLAIQSPSGKILRMTRKVEQGGSRAVETAGGENLERLGSAWETIVKVGERGVWRGLVLADRSVRWCVFGEWDCV